MPNADWKKCAVWVALPTTQTTASQPMTGNGSRAASYSTSPTSCCSCSRLELGELLVVGEGLLEAHGCSSIGVVAGEHAHRIGAGCATSAVDGWSARCNHGLRPASATVQIDQCDAITRGAAGRGSDALDLALLGALREHPKAGALELSRRLGVARGTVQARLQRLEDGGVITGYGPDIDLAAAGFAVQAFVTLEIAQGALDDVTADLAAMPGVLEAYATTGIGDVLCRMAARSHGDLQQTLLQLEPVGLGRPVDQRGGAVGAGAARARCRCSPRRAARRRGRRGTAGLTRRRWRPARRLGGWRRSVPPRGRGRRDVQEKQDAAGHGQVVQRREGVRVHRARRRRAGRLRALLRDRRRRGLPQPGRGAAGRVHRQPG